MDRTQHDRLYNLLKEQSKKQIPIQTAWGIVKQVNWEEKTATVVGVVDGLEYYDVALGIGHKILKPKLNTKCIIGAIGNQEVDAFMMDCDEVDEIIFTADDAEIKVTKDGLILQHENESLKEILKELLEELNGAIIKTPSGPGKFAETSKLKFTNLKDKVLKLFK
ncbi:hypothetical protein [Faecalibacter macacae]|uniref:hypothetical protein n=1 Tax=Faecalibacter macacae TaxID=1859289 RepID=UPI0011C37D0B|nr:hypothetical protein [Faecalibacter macacae]